MDQSSTNTSLLTRQLTTAQSVAFALLLGALVTGAAITALAVRQTQRLEITCQYARAGLTPRADSLLTDTLTWCPR